MALFGLMRQMVWRIKEMLRQILGERSGKGEEADIWTSAGVFLLSEWRFCKSGIEGG